MKYLLKRLDAIIILILVISLFTNWYLLTHRPEPVIRTITEIREIEKPRVVTKIETVYRTQRVTVDRSDLTEQAKALLFDQISKEELKIETAPVYIVEKQDGSIFISEIITGSATLEPLHWDISIKLTAKELYRQPIIPLDLGYMLTLKGESDLGVVFDLPILSQFDIMLGLKTYNLCYTMPLSKTAKWRVGLANTYAGDTSLVFGIKFKVF